MDFLFVSRILILAQEVPSFSTMLGIVSCSTTVIALGILCWTALDMLIRIEFLVSVIILPVEPVELEFCVVSFTEDPLESLDLPPFDPDLFLS